MMNNFRLYKILGAPKLMKKGNTGRETFHGRLLKAWAAQFRSKVKLS